MLGGADLERHPADREHVAGRLDRVLEGRRAAGAPPAGLLAVARQHHRRGAAAGRAARPAARPARPRWARGQPAGSARPAARRAAAGTPGPVSNSATSANPRPTLRFSTRSRPGSSVVRSSGSSSRIGLTSRGARRRGSPAGSCSRSASAAEPNGLLMHLYVAGSGQRAADRAAQPLRGGEAAPGGRARHPHRDVLVALQPDDLLGQVVGVGEVGPPGRRPDQRAAQAGPGSIGDLAADLAQPAQHGRRAVGHPGHLVRVVRRHRHRDRRHLGRACVQPGTTRSRRPARPAATRPWPTRAAAAPGPRPARTWPRRRRTAGACGSSARCRPRRSAPPRSPRRASPR